MEQDEITVVGTQYKPVELDEFTQPSADEIKDYIKNIKDLIAAYPSKFYFDGYKTFLESCTNSLLGEGAITQEERNFMTNSRDFMVHSYKNYIRQRKASELATKQFDVQIFLDEEIFPTDDFDPAVYNPLLSDQSIFNSLKTTLFKHGDKFFEMANQYIDAQKKFIEAAEEAFGKLVKAGVTVDEKTSIELAKRFRELGEYMNKGDKQIEELKESIKVDETKAKSLDQFVEAIKKQHDKLRKNAPQIREKCTKQTKTIYAKCLGTIGTVKNDEFFLVLISYLRSKLFHELETKVFPKIWEVETMPKKNFLLDLHEWYPTYFAKRKAELERFNALNNNLNDELYNLYLVAFRTKVVPVKDESKPTWVEYVIANYWYTRVVFQRMALLSGGMFKPIWI